MKVSRSNGLFGIFRSLMPRDERFVERFCEHSGLIVPAAEAFHSLISGDGPPGQWASEISRLEESADQVTRLTVLAIHRTFVTPFDRSQILELITALDDTIDLMKDTSRRVVRYGVTFTPEMQGMAECIVRASREIREGMPFLGSIESSGPRLNAMSTAVRQIEGEADELLDRGLRTLFASDLSPGAKLTVEKVYDL